MDGWRGRSQLVTILLNNMFFLISLNISPAGSVRCYTDLEKTKSLSVECGLNTACVKIFKKSQGFDEFGHFIPPERRASDVTMFRGCFLVRLPDTCYESTSNRLTYCWCSNADLCNSVLPLYNLSYYFKLTVILLLATHAILSNLLLWYWVLGRACSINELSMIKAIYRRRKAFTNNNINTMSFTYIFVSSNKPHTSTLYQNQKN